MSDFEISERKLRASPEFFIFFYNSFFAVASIIKGIKKSSWGHELKKKVPYRRPLLMHSEPRRGNNQVLNFFNSGILGLIICHTQCYLSHGKIKFQKSF